MTDFLNKLNHHRNAVTGLLLIAAGILFCWNPLWAPRVVLEVLGAFLMIDGILALIRYLSSRSTALSILELVKIAFGAYLLFRTDKVLSLALGVFGLVILLAGIARAVRGWHGPFALLSVLFTALLIICGASMLFHPLNTAAAVFVRVGVLLIICGAVRLFTKEPARPIDPDTIIDV